MLKVGCCQPRTLTGEAAAVASHASSLQAVHGSFRRVSDSLNATPTARCRGAPHEPFATLHSAAASSRQQDASANINKMAKPAPPSKKGEHAKRNAAHKKRRAARDLPKTNKKTAKNRLRDAERWLRRLETNGADQEQIGAAQKAVEELRREKASDEIQRKRIDKEKRYAERYRKVKFFEKRKVLRRLKRLKREMASDTPPHDGKARLEALEGDLAYVSFYPKDRKYVGLFTVRGAEDARTAKRRAEARKLALAAAAAAASASSSSSSSDDDESDDEDVFADDAAASDGEASGDFFLAA